MKQRFTVRKHPHQKGYWCVWDRLEDRVLGHVRASKFDVTDQCKHFNRLERKVSA